jgi:predicted MFS family arabinose efflux permease
VLRDAGGAAQISEAGAHARGNLWHEMRFGFRFIWARPGLLGLAIFFALATFFSVITYFGTLPAMILSRQGGGEMALAWVQSALGAGALVGSLLASTWGGPKRKIHAVLAGAAISFMLGDLMFAFGQNVFFWIIAGFCGESFVPLIIAGSNAIWQSKVPPDVQGRVFAAQSAFSDLPGPIGYLIAGPLADRVMNPGMMPGGALAPIFGPLVGVGPGAGIAAMFIFTGFSGIIVSLAGYLWRSVRDVETDLPDAHPSPVTLDGPAVAEAAA